MHEKDIVSKQLLKRMTLGMARVLLGLDIHEFDLIETEIQRVEERRADFVAKVKNQEGGYILHIEIQNDNQSNMPWRMLRYLIDIKLAYPKLEVSKYLIYIGRKKIEHGVRHRGSEARLSLSNTGHILHRLRNFIAAKYAGSINISGIEQL